MATLIGSGPIMVSVSTDGMNWTEIGECIVGSIYLYDAIADDLEEITPDNPLYAELVAILEKAG